MKYNKYSFQKYVYPDRWISYWHQIDATLRLTPENGLVVGKSDGIVVDILKKYIPRVESLDTEEKLEPDIVASVENMPLPDKSFDVVLAAEILEPLPFDKFKTSLSEIRRVAKKGSVISLPHRGYTFSLSFKIPLIKWKRFIIKIPHFWKTKTSTPEHYWELGMKGYSKKTIKKIIYETGFKIKTSFVKHDDPSHIFLILT